MHTQQIRQKFLNYFKKHAHQVISSSPVVPHDDPTLLFTNAGMNQFKDVFLGKSKRDYTRAATSQKCIRVGGKHNDLDNVGHTSRHLTFFEMLGNFSFGDYFKADAIKFAWEVSTEIFGFDPERIWPTVFREDDEAFELWTQYVPAIRITRFDEKDNFWAMGDTGPCGPCSELLYDRGQQYGKGTRPSEDPSGERFLEFWNLVFMQFNRLSADKIEPLPRPSIDTGSGLERVVSLKMDVDSVFETDVLRGLIGGIENIAKVTYRQEDTLQAPAFRVIADHLRCLAFAIADGVQPSNVDRGYVLRKVLRRAVRYGRTLGLNRPFLAEVLPTLCQLMGKDYPELYQSQARIAEILTIEEESFIHTLQRGGNILNTIVDTARSSQQKQISGEQAFKLKDTYGFPIEEIQLIAKDADLKVDLGTYQKLEEEAKERSRSTQKTVQQIASDNLFEEFLQQHGSTEFVGYTLQNTSSQVLALVIDGQFVDRLAAGQEGTVILDKTPFYAEMGGQVGDTGTLKADSKLFKVNHCYAPFKGLIAHTGTLEQGELRVGDALHAHIDSSRRQKIANNHTATHLLHWALHQVLGEHVKQAGSIVDNSRLRFDFSHHKALSVQEMHRIEDLINEKIRENTPVRAYEIAYEEAQKRQDIKQFFGEKYGNRVRVIDIDYSKELCGGTHIQNTGSIGLFRIAKESSIAAGVRRIEAVTGAEAELLTRQNELLLSHLANLLKAQPAQLQEKIEKLIEEGKQTQQELKNFKKEQLKQLASSIVTAPQYVNEIAVICKRVSLDPEEFKLCAEDIMQQLKSGVLVLASDFDNKCQLLVRVSDDLVGRGIKANDLVKALAPVIEGTGGGRPNSAQAGGKAPQNIEQAFEKALQLL